jgi:hypothetical protein
MPPPIRPDARDVARRDGLGVVDAPARLIAGLLEDRLEHVEDSRDRLVVGRMLPDRPLFHGDQPRHVGKLAFHLRLELGARGHEVLEVGIRPDQNLSGAFENVTVQPRCGAIDVALLLGDQLFIKRALGSGLLREQEV